MPKLKIRNPMFKSLAGFVVLLDLQTGDLDAKPYIYLLIIIQIKKFSKTFTRITGLGKCPSTPVSYILLVIGLL